ncbi:MAG: multifunctional 2',3'-cyclic-nucleotide 2'-phosphodiesterase/5'-nucleotidase/3'-nucleotidase [Candidatus Eisenbacteria bacterium]|nr:multifunctional 2',3'-cyclic-nucleotide 2'-phosphodiesterase/5'-nucleotidase/3'-nucleotidase [Candidatus Eisenbacteria bacterium]
MRNRMTRQALWVAVAAAVLLAAAPAGAADEDGLVRLSVIFTNDIHGGIDPTGATFMNPEFPPPLGGAASAKAYIDRVREQAREEGGYVLIIDQGDIFQGTPVGNYRNGESVIEYFNHVPIDLWTIGNHDFDEGIENLWHLVEMSEMPVLSANLRWEDGTEIDLIEPYVMKDYNGIKVAVIGLTTTDTPQMAFPEHVKGVQFLPAIPTAERYVEEAREKGADIVFISGHMGLPYDPEEGYEEMIQEEEERGETVREPLEEGKWGANAMEIAHAVPGIDVFFGGHIHKGFDKPWEEPSTHTLLFQTYGRGSGVGHVDILIDPETESIAGYDLPSIRGGLITLFEDEHWPDPEMDAMVTAFVEEAEEGMDRVVGYTEVNLTRGGEGETRMGNLVCDAMREETDADFAFTNLGGIRDEIPAGPITPRQVFRVLPFGNSLIVYEISGRLLKQIIEYRVSADHHGVYMSGAEIVYNKTRPDYDRITHFKVGGEQWEPDKIYRVTTSDFLAAGNAGLYMLPGIPDDQTMRTSTTIKDAVIHYIERHTPINVELDGRWQRDDTAEKDPALAEAMEGMEPLKPPDEVETGPYE